MKFKELLIRKTSLPKEVQKLFPASYQLIGDVLLVKMPEFVGKRYGQQIAGIIFDNFPYVKTVCWLKGISGEFRQPKVQVLAGKSTETMHKELGCKFELDVSKIMWSKGNHFERSRLIPLVKNGETIVDMFAGVGYWSVILAKQTKAKEIYALEKNPVAYAYLAQNIRLNYLANVTPILGDCRKVKLDAKADRIIMGYFPGTLKFLPAALKLSKRGTTIHFHELASDVKSLERKILRATKRKVKNLAAREVKEYSSSKKHYVFDLKVL